MSDDALLVDIADNVSRITINRPDAAHAIDLAMGQALRPAANPRHEDPHNPARRRIKEALK